MGRYGEVAVGAVSQVVKGSASSARAAWEQEAVRVFGAGTQADKGCPRTTFLALCSVGVVNGVPSGNYVNLGSPNSLHALAALDVLRERGDVFASGRALWHTLGLLKTYNQQMDVVLALWRSGLMGAEIPQQP